MLNINEKKEYLEYCLYIGGLYGMTNRDVLKLAEKEDPSLIPQLFKRNKYRETFCAPQPPKRKIKQFTEWTDLVPKKEHVLPTSTEAAVFPPDPLETTGRRKDKRITHEKNELSAKFAKSEYKIKTDVREALDISGMHSINAIRYIIGKQKGVDSNPLVKVIHSAMTNNGIIEYQGKFAHAGAKWKDEYGILGRKESKRHPGLRRIVSLNTDNHLIHSILEKVFAS